MPKHTKNKVPKMKPLNKPRKELSPLQKKLMMSHKKHHTAKHMAEMRKMMKKGFCFEQAHNLSMKIVGK